LEQPVAERKQFQKEAMKKLLTEGSARVEISPNDFESPAAIFLKIRLMIFPERVYQKKVIKK
jgi:hypothetical protein